MLLIPIALGTFIAFFGDKFYETEKAIFNAVRVLAPLADIPSRAITELGSAVGVIAITAIILIVTIICSFIKLSNIERVSYARYSFRL